MNVILKLFSIDTLIEFVVAHLAAHVKNPRSAAAIRLRFIVAKLHDATGEFLRETGG